MQKEALKHLRTSLDAYCDKYETITFRREDGILEMALGTDGGPLVWGRQAHAELEEAFLNIGRDRDNQVVILTGTGDVFSGPVPEARDNRNKHHQSPDAWGELGWEANRLHANMLAVDVPMISAVNGPATRHAELPVMCDIVLAGEAATFQDSAHFVGGLVPGDGVHVVFPMIMGLNRGRYFLLTGQELDAKQALDYGLVNEILPADALLPRAWELARQMLAQPELNRRYSRLLLVEDLRRRMSEMLPYGLALEGLCITRPVDG
ncbi:MAG: enoyl-CoA hydratase/isomerase family protein [Hyphomicrobiales bacterium]|nr:enoyl-CoA hydratase/isomerase family protein [Hyphomicrobiales bacterium]MCP5001726.1 enoyl-CoA hydratase/isomerase family protein [Hyphomicrobiales bacterium]